MAAQAELIIVARGGKEAEGQIKLIDSAVVSARKQLETFKKSGGLAALAVGNEKIAAAEKQVEALAVALVNADARLLELANDLKTTDVGSDAYIKLQTEIAETEAKAANLRAEIKKLPRDLRESVTDTAGFLGDIDTSLATLAGSISGLGASPLGRIAGSGLQQGLGPLAGVGQGLQIGADIFAAAEALPRLSAAMGTLKANTLAYIPTLGAQAAANSTLAASAGAAAGGVGTVSGSLAALAVATGPYLLAAGAVVGTLVALKEISAAQRDMAEEVIETEQARTKALRTQRQAVLDLTSAEIDRQRRGLEVELRLLQDEQAALEAGRAAFEENNEGSDFWTIAMLQEAEKINAAAKEGAGGIFGGLVDFFYPDSLSGANTEYAKRNVELQASIDGVTERLEALNTAFSERSPIDNLISSLDEANALEDERARLLRDGTTEGLRESASELEREIVQRERNIAAARELQSRYDENSAGYQLLNTYIQENTDANADATELLALATGEAYAAAEAREAETAAMERNTAAIKNNVAAMGRELQKINELQGKRKQLRDQLEGIDQQLKDIGDTQERNAAREKERADLKADQDRREGDLQAKIDAAKLREQAAKRSADILAIQQDAHKKELAKLQDIGKAEEKAETEFNKAVNELQRDALEAKIKHEQDKARIERESNAKLLQAQADRDVVAYEREKAVKDERLAGLDAEAQEQARQRQQRADDLRAQFEAERQERRIAGQQAIQEIRNEAAARVQAVQESGQTVVSEVAKLEQQLAELRKTFAQEEADLKAKFDAADHQRQINSLMQRRAAIVSEMEKVNRSLEAADRIYQNWAKRLGLNVVSNFVAGLSATLSSAAPTLRLKGFATGGVTEGGQPFMAGEQGRELLWTDKEMAVWNNRTTEAFLAGTRMGGTSGQAGGAEVKIYINGNFGAIATPADLETLKAEVVAGVRQGGIAIRGSV